MRLGSLPYTPPPTHKGRYIGDNINLIIEYFVSPKKALFDFVSAKSSCGSIAEQLFFMFHKYLTWVAILKKARKSIRIVRPIHYDYNVMT